MGNNKEYSEVDENLTRERKKLWRKFNKGKEIERQRQLYYENSCKREKKREVWKIKQAKLKKETTQHRERLNEWRNQIGKRN